MAGSEASPKSSAWWTPTCNIPPNCCPSCGRRSSREWSRYAEEGRVRNWHPVRHGVSRLAIWLTWPLQKPAIHVQDPMSGFFLVRRACLRNVHLETQGFKILLEILVRGNVKSVTEVPFSFGRREAGNSKAGIKEGLDYLFLLGRLCRVVGLRRSATKRQAGTPESR